MDETRESENPELNESNPNSARLGQFLDGEELLALFRAATNWLEAHKAEIDALNVFPVPDGDTGTNMMMTMRSAMAQATSEKGQRASDLLRALARGAVRGARGNSGVILSQILSGFARAVEDRDQIDVRDLARSFRRASDSAYQAVVKPVEGTILTVARASADAAEDAAHEDTIEEMFHRVSTAARRALQQTPDLLPILKEAGVVDSGGKGLFTLIEGMHRHLRGEAPHKEEGDGQTTEISAFPVDVHLDEPPPFLADGRYGYDIQYLIQGDNLPIETIREHIASLGDCPLVVGDSTLIKVHVHVLDPGPALAYGAAQGMLDDVVVENLDLQFEAFSAAQSQSETPRISPPTTESVTNVAIVVVAAGEGLQALFRDLGASAVVTGGQTMNPSTEELLNAVDSVGGGSVILLPNNKNIIMAAEQAARLSERPLYIVPTRSAPEGMAALMAFDYSADAESNAQVMTEASQHPITVEITRAVRTTRINDLPVHDGDPIALVNGELTHTGQDIPALVVDVLSGLDLEEYEIVTILTGADLSQADGEQLQKRLEDHFPELEVEVHAGGQPHYPFILSIE